MDADLVRDVRLHVILTAMKTTAVPSMPAATGMDQNGPS